MLCRGNEINMFFHMSPQCCRKKNTILNNFLDTKMMTYYENVQRKTVGIPPAHPLRY